MVRAPGPERLEVVLPGGGALAGLLDRAARPLAQLVLAHGAGAGMEHAFMAAAAAGLAARGVTTLRFQFPFMQAGSRRPDRPEVAQAAVRAAAAAAGATEPGVALFAGGKSFGGRMTSQAQAAGALPGVRGLVFLGFPLHAANKPDVSRAAHLEGVGVPMLFLQGTRDALAGIEAMREVAAGLGARARLEEVAGADHGFHVPARSGRSDGEVLEGMLDVVVGFMRGVAGA